MKKASAFCEKESTAFAAEEKESMEVVDMIQGAAVAVIEKELGGEAFMMQIKTAAIVDILKTMRCYA